MSVKLAEKLRMARRGRSYVEIAHEVGCTPGNIRKIEAESSQPGFVLGVRLAEALGVPVNWLADDSADWPPPATPQQSAETLVREALTGAGLTGELTPPEREVLRLYRMLEGDNRKKIEGMLLGLAFAGTDAAELADRLGRALKEDNAHEKSGKT